MPQFLFRYCQMFSFLGAGTPEDPGGDFGMDCWIEAPDKSSAVQWGYVLLGDYCKARYAHSADGYRHDGSPIEEGYIEDDAEMLDIARKWKIPSCRIGEIPGWRQPWRHSNVDP